MSSATEENQTNEEAARKAILIRRIEALRQVLQAETSTVGDGLEIRHRTYKQNEIQDAVARAALAGIGGGARGIEMVYFSIPTGKAVLRTGDGRIVATDFDGFGFDGSEGTTKTEEWVGAWDDSARLEAIAAGLLSILDTQMTRNEGAINDLAESQKRKDSSVDAEKRKSGRAELKRLEVATEKLGLAKKQDRKAELEARKIGKIVKTKPVLVKDDEAPKAKPAARKPVAKKVEAPSKKRKR